MNDEFLGFLRRVGLGTFLRPPNQLVNPLYLEIGFWALVVLLFLLLRLNRRTRQWLPRMEWTLRRIGRYQRACVMSAFVLPILLRLLFFIWVPTPVPAIHDEFSYLLQSDTFAHWHVTNPSHPMAVHFESFHVNMWPTYQSMYPPGQAVFLAFGQLLFGYPYLGVLLTLGLMCAAIVWALQAWFPPEWPVLAGIYCIVRFSTFSYWGNSYWGGAAAAFGGAVLFGILGRVKKNPSPWYAIAYAFALLLLANTRAYEGFVFSVIPTIALIWILVRSHPAKTIVRFAAPAVVILAIGFATMGYYNYRGTGSPARMPYMVNAAEYHITKPFLWQSRNPIPNYRHPHLRHFFVYWELPAYMMSRYPEGLWILTRVKLGAYYCFYLWPLALILLPAWWIMLFRSRRLRLFAATALLVLAGLLLESWAAVAHYAAPATVCVLALWLFAFRWVRQWRFRGDRFGTQFAAAILIVLGLWIGVRQANFIFDPHEFYGIQAYCLQDYERARIETVLKRTPGQHLVIVHQRRVYDGGRDWVYNDANIDASKIIWARDMGWDKNKELTQYYRGRHVWYVDQSDGLFQLHPYHDADPFQEYALKAIQGVPLAR
ncbi:MAG TPA: hypothetical protein VF135_11765 [Terriglobales bacterium]